MPGAWYAFVRNLSIAQFKKVRRSKKPNVKKILNTAITIAMLLFISTCAVRQFPQSVYYIQGDASFDAGIL